MPLLVLTLNRLDLDAMTAKTHQKILIMRFYQILVQIQTPNTKINCYQSVCDIYRPLRQNPNHSIESDQVRVLEPFATKVTSSSSYFGKVASLEASPQMVAQLAEEELYSSAHLALDCR